MGETSRSLKDVATEEHFNLKGHDNGDIKMSIIEKLHSISDQYRKQRENMCIVKFNTKYKRKNKKQKT